jgi:alkylation response protein AidB-like acyl-CoA dehydrogenase
VTIEFDLDADQLDLQKAVATFCADRFPPAVARAAGDGLDRGRWRELAGLGTFGLALPEADGGVGLRAIDAVVVFEQLGRHLVPGPLVATFLAAGPADGVVAGDTVVALAEPRPGRPTLVAHLGDADQVLVLPRGDDADGAGDLGGSLVDADAVRAHATAVEPLDPASPVWLVDALPEGRPLPAPAAAAARRTGSLLTSALLLGLADAATDLAVAYAKERHQFGRAIGSFQAVKHIAADMFARTQVARASAYAAGVLVDEPGDDDVARAVAGARVMAGRAAVDNGKACTQVHGGIGFSWEADVHLFLKRAWVLATQYGSVDEAADTVAARLAAV